MKPAFRSRRAQADIEAAPAYYDQEAPHMVEKFVDALENAVARIERSPAIGSPRYAHELNLPGLRYWMLRRFPYALYYFEHAEHLSVVRAVHLRRDIPVTLQFGE